MNRDVDTSRVNQMMINPLEMNGLGCRNSDDNSILDLDKYETPHFDNCKYIFADEFKGTCIKEGKERFSFIHINSRSVSHNFDELCSMLAELDHEFTAIGISETWFHSNTVVSMFNINGYTLVHSDRQNKIGGGVGIYISNKYDYVIRSDLSRNTPEYDSLFIELKFRKKKSVLIGCVYRVPNTDAKHFIDDMNTHLDVMDIDNKEIYIMGDFNLNLLNADAHENTNIFFNAMLAHNLYPIIDKPTRISRTSSTLIDNIFSNSLHDKSSGLIIADISDHLPIFCVVNQMHVFPNTQSNVPIKTRNISFENIRKFKNELKDIDWTQIYEIDDVNDCYNKFMYIFHALYDKCFPEKVVKPDPKCKFKKPWLTRGLFRSIRKKQRLYKSYLKTPSENHKKKYKQYKNKLTKLLHAAKKDYYTTIFIRIKGNSKKMWNKINDVIGKRKNTKLPSTMYNGNVKLDTMKKIAEEFNTYFLSIGKNIASKIPNCNRTFDSFLPKDPPQESLFLKPTSVQEIIKYSCSLDPSKSCGADGISPKVIKQCIHSFVEPLCFIFNKSLYTGIIPNELKLAQVIPLYKKDNKNDITNYRPIAVIPIFAKLLEKLVHQRLYSFLQLHSILIDEQFGFRQKHSTDLAVFNLSQNILEQIESGNYCIGLFMDLSKAFDTIDHHILLQKLNYYGVRGTARDWFVNYLSDRKQYVVVNGVKSTTHCNTCGVPQGSVLGPLLFLIYINDIVNSSNIVKFSLFADDTCVTFSHKNINTLVSSLNKEIQNISVWFKSNKLSLNLTKTNYIIFRSRNRRVPNNLESIQIDNRIITKLQNVKFLGITFNEFLSWNVHVTDICKHVAKGVGLLRKLKYVLPSNVLQMIYNCLVLPHLNYCNQVWGNTYKSHILKLFTLQKKAVRIISKSHGLSPSSPLFKKLRLLSIYDLVTLNTLIFMFNVHAKVIPDKYCNMFILNSNVHTYNTRQCKNYHQPNVRSTSGLNSLAYKGIKKWNQLPENIRSSTTKSRFKTLCKRYLVDSCETC